MQPSVLGPGLDITLGLGHEEVVTGLRAETVELAVVLAAQPARPHPHATDRISTSTPQVRHAYLDPRPLPWFARDLHFATAQRRPFSHADESPTASTGVARSGRYKS